MRNRWGLCFVEKAGSNYKTNTPAKTLRLDIKRQELDEVFVLKTSRRQDRVKLQNEDPRLYASVYSTGNRGAFQHLSCKEQSQKYNIILLLSNYFRVKLSVFKIRPGLFYKTKTSSISHLLTSDKGFKPASSFYSLTRSFLQNEDLIDFVSLDV